MFGGVTVNLQRMTPSADILALAYKRPVFQDELELLQEREQQIPGSVQFSVKRYQRLPQWSVEDMGMMVYNVQQPQQRDKYLELHFCLSGNVYCYENASKCAGCRERAAVNCREKIESVDVLSFRFSPGHLSQFVKPRKADLSLPTAILDFSHSSSFSKTLAVCGRSRSILEGLLSNNFTGSLENIYVNAQTQMLLLYSLDCMVGEKEVEAFQCKFLANDQDREKIVKAREVLIQHIGEPITIKELSKKVAINECYLKKGFKELFGTTIFDFYQSQRMEHARYLLYEKELSVTDVSMLLGYSSISHFSTAFKRHTGLKPCELLFRN